jgi:hypothetical protein
MKKFSNHFKNHVWHYVAGLVGLMITSFGFAADDPLALSIKPGITALFGTGSTVSYGIYIGEIILGAVAYIKSKNPMVLVGVPILVLFTHGMFSYISG